MLYRTLDEIILQNTQDKIFFMYIIAFLFHHLALQKHILFSRANLRDSSQSPRINAPTASCHFQLISNLKAKN